MAGIDRLAEVMGRDNDMDAIERDNLADAAATEIKRLADRVRELEGALIEARGLIAICDDEREAREIIPLLRRIDAALSQKDKQG